MAAIGTARRGRASAPAMGVNRSALRWTGGFGLGAAALLLVTAPLYASMGTPPSLGDGDALTAFLVRNQYTAITTKLIDTLYVMGFVVFAAGVRELIRRADSGHEWDATLGFALALLASAVVLVGDVLGAAAALDTYTTPDASSARALSVAALPAFGAVSLIAYTAFLATTGLSLLATRALPAWAGWTALAAALLNLAAAPTIYGGGDFLAMIIAGRGGARPYSYATVVAGMALITWLAAVGSAMIWGGRGKASATVAGEGERPTA